MRVLFSYQQFSGEYGLFGHFARRNSTWAPLAQALLAAVCEEAGHEAIILDGQANQWGTERMAQEVVKLKPDIVGVNAYSPFFHLSADLAAAIKKINPEIPVMGGGPHFTIVKEKAMLPGFDYGFLGEAEDSLPEFLNVFRTFPRALGNVRGIMYRKDGKVVSTGERWVKAEAMTKKELAGPHPLDRFPFPARHLLDMRAYKLGTPKGRLHFTSLQTARGCPWTCIFCASDALKTTRYIMKSPKRVVEEMKDVATHYPFTKHIYIVDDVLTFWPEHVIEICDRMDAEGLKFYFASLQSADSIRLNVRMAPNLRRLRTLERVRISDEAIPPYSHKWKLKVRLENEIPRTWSEEVPFVVVINRRRRVRIYVERRSGVRVSLPKNSHLDTHVRARHWL